MRTMLKYKIISFAKVVIMVILMSEMKGLTKRVLRNLRKCRLNIFNRPGVAGAVL